MTRVFSMAFLLGSMLIAAQDTPFKGLSADQLAAMLADKQLQQKGHEKLHQAIREAEARRSGNPKVIVALVSLLEFRWKYDWEDGFTWIRPITRGDRYPACAALAAIGEPALPQLLEVLQSSPCDSVRFTNSVLAVRHTFRDNSEKGEAFMKQAIDSASSSQHKQNLEAAFKCLSDREGLLFDPDGKYDWTCCGQ